MSKITWDSDGNRYVDGRIASECDTLPLNLRQREVIALERIAEALEVLVDQYRRKA